MPELTLEQWCAIFPQAPKSLVAKLHAQHPWVLELSVQGLEDPTAAHATWFWSFTKRMRHLGEKRCRTLPPKFLHRFVFELTPGFRPTVRPRNGGKLRPQSRDARKPPNPVTPRANHR